MKDLLYSASIKSGATKIVSNTNSDWSKILEGSLIRFKDDPIFYSVAKINKVFIFEKFEALDLRRIKIASNTGFSISKHDDLHLAWDEFEFSSIAGISESGSGYKENDIIECKEGVALENISNSETEYAQFKVSDVGPNGEIKQISLEKRGTYFVKPNKISCPMVGGNGTGAIFDLIFFNKENKGFAAKSVQVINSFETETIILLDSNLPKGLKAGSLSLNKWEITLNTPYIGEDQINSPYELYFDFTPFCKMPMPSKHSLGLDLILKNTQLILDRKIAELDKRIVELELTARK